MTNDSRFNIIIHFEINGPVKITNFSQILCMAVYMYVVCFNTFSRIHGGDFCQLFSSL